MPFTSFLLNLPTDISVTSFLIADQVRIDAVQVAGCRERVLQAAVRERVLHRAAARGRHCADGSQGGRVLPGADEDQTRLRRHPAEATALQTGK